MCGEREVLSCVWGEGGVVMCVGRGRCCHVCGEREVLLL